MDERDRYALTPHARRAMPFIAAALAVIVVASLLYLRANAPPHKVAFIPSPSMPTLAARFSPEYEFLTPTVGWALITLLQPNPNPFWVFKTTDGAKHWQPQFQDLAPTGNPSIHFFDQSNGIVAFTPDIAYFYRTVDGGAQWKQVPLPAGVVVPAYTDRKHFWVLAGASPDQAANQLMYSADGGASWQARTWPAGALWTGKGGLSLAFRPSGEGWLGTEGNAAVQLTRDGGMTWSLVTMPVPAVALPSPIPGGKQFPPPPYIFQSDVALLPGAGVVAFVTDYFGNTTVYESFDRGQSWRLLNAPPNPTTFNDIAFLDSKHWWAMRFGYLFKTSDAGLTWKATHVAPLQENWDYQPVNVIDSRHAWSLLRSAVRTTAGTALSMTSDGGASWNPVNVPQPV